MEGLLWFGTCDYDDPNKIKQSSETESALNLDSMYLHIEKLY